MPGMWWVVGVVAVVALLSAYLTWTARRVDRLHVRGQAAARALDAHLLRRAAAAAVVAERWRLGRAVRGRPASPWTPNRTSGRPPRTT